VQIRAADLSLNASAGKSFKLCCMQRPISKRALCSPSIQSVFACAYCHYGQSTDADPVRATDVLAPRSSTLTPCPFHFRRCTRFLMRECFHGRVVRSF
jgi:hypothetical protein